MNVTVVQGHLSSAPTERTLPSGDRMVSLEVSVMRPDEKKESVPVSWPNAPAQVLELAPGTPVMVLGRIRRRFFRAAGFTQSRTEVVADMVVPGRSPKKVASLLSKAHARLDE
jgi:single-strand DNA-binding protein